VDGIAQNFIDRRVEAEALSTDYLNRFGEALMLIEMSLVDDSVAAELAAWRPVGYVAHFSQSQLRCAPHALAAYQALDPIARGAFEALCMAMSRLVETAVLTLREAPDPAASRPVIEIAATAFRNLLSRATAFINSGGDMAEAVYDNRELQDVIDKLIHG
jgi:hypothetical protein